MQDYIRAAYVVDRYMPFVTEDDLKILTHINIAFGLVVDGKISVAHCKNLDQIERIRKIKPSIKIILSVGGWGAGGFSNAAKTPEGLQKFADSAVEIQKKYALDGIDIDWEYPCIDWAGIDAAPEDKVNFTSMLEYLRKGLDGCTAYDGGRCILTIAAGAGKYFPENTEIKKIVEILDFISIMTYDLAGQFGGYTGHHTNLFDPKTDDPRFAWSADSTVKCFNEAGLPPEKTVLGAAFYSRAFDNVENKNNGLNQKTGTHCLYGPGYTDLYENYINKNGFVRYWDDTAKAPYLFNGSKFITYDDPESMALKCDYIKEKRLLGIMYWEHSCDKTRQLLNVIGKHLV